MSMFGKSSEELKAEPGGVMGPVTVQLADDMLTVVSEPKRIMPPVTTGTDWDAHPFFEGSSIRKIGETYYFIYSTWHNHELCYATSDNPDEGFRFRGVIISNGDIGYHCRRPEDRLWVTGNNHGSIEQINGQWYVFYHRHTHARNCCRQACAEPVEILPDGSILQVEMTSCGLNGGPLRDIGTYPAVICCNLTNGYLPHNEDRNASPAPYPHISSDETGPFVCGVENETWVGYKYFQFIGPRKLTITYRGRTDGTLSVHNCIGGDALAQLKLTPAQEWTEASVTVPFHARKSGLFLRFTGEGTLDLRSFTLA